jgi:uncharacterized protein
MFEWDEFKRKQNLLKHGMDLASVYDFDWTTAFRSPDGRQEYGEMRYVALGHIGSRLHVCVYTMRRRKVRIISLRKANKREEKFYEEKTSDN